MRRFTQLSICLLVVGLLLAGQTPRCRAAESVSQRDARMAWWRDARFGMFVHWGLYSGLAGTWEGKPVSDHGGMEWIQQRVQADTDAYAKTAVPLFQPKPGFAKAWARMAKQAGCRYVVFTTKHHEGFALHNSQLTDFDAGSTLNRDLVKEIVSAIRAEGLRVGFYHSVIDWHHDQYEYARSAQLPHPLHGKPYPNGTRDHALYVKFLHAQVRELVKNYPVDILWWDYSSQDFQGDAAWRATDLMSMVREYRPRIIMNNRLYRTPEAGWSGMGTAGFLPRLDPAYGDFITPEQHIPDTGMPDVDWETCMTMNTTWGYSEHDHAWKSSEVLIRNLVDIASKGGNYLLNIGPKADGTVPVQSVNALEEMGRWMRVNGQSIYGTSASPFDKPAWGRCTQKSLMHGRTRLYLHVFEWPSDGQLRLHKVPGEPITARLLDGKQKLKMLRNGPELILLLPQRAPDPAVSVIALDLKR